MEEKMGEEEEEQANKKIVKEAVALVQHARSNPSIIYYVYIFLLAQCASSVVNTLCIKCASPLFCTMGHPHLITALEKFVP